jgi:hypothetical protein
MNYSTAGSKGSLNNNFAESALRSSSGLGEPLRWRNAAGEGIAPFPRNPPYRLPFTIDFNAKP